ncbi:MAG: oligosaccharide flippase family protein [Candidatus Schekmanbacteria bacterium]|nr:oligosaccharide flippase family protein [Candidatus Schekmanbacteria bacterium]
MAFERKKIIKESGLILSANGVKLFSGFITFMIFSRTLGSEALGIFAVTVSFAEIVNELFEFGFDTASVSVGAKYDAPNNKIDNSNKLSSIVSTNLILKLITGVALFALGGVLSRPFAELIFQNPEMSSYLFIGFCAIPGLLIFDVALSVFRMEQSFTAYAILRGGGAILTLSVSAVLAFYGILTLKSALIVYLVAIPVVTGFAGIAYGYRRYRLSAPDIKTTSAELFRFGRWIYLANITEALRLKMNNFLLVKYSSPKSAGLYYTADRLSEALVLISSTISTLLLPKASSMTEKAELRSFTIKSVKVISLISIPVLIVIPFSGDIISLLFGEGFKGAAAAFILIFLSLLVEIICKPFLFALFSLGDSKVIFRQNVIILPVLLLAAYFMIPAYAEKGAALALLIARFFGNLYLLREGYVKIIK